jgi:hypothetical protein
MHGTRMMSWQEIRQFYGREVVNLRHEGRWVFLNTLFSVSEAVMYMQVGGGIIGQHMRRPVQSGRGGVTEVVRVLGVGWWWWWVGRVVVGWVGGGG